MKILQHDKTKYKDLPFSCGANLNGHENICIKAYKCNTKRWILWIGREAK